MSDPRLNSVHLDGSRRESFRLARAFLLDARGPSTQAAEHRDDWYRHDRADRTYNLFPLQHHSATAAKYWLQDREGVYPLKVGLNVIGRAHESDVIVRDPYVSRRHCAIVVHSDGGCELYDIASKNGTELNGRKLAGPSRLHSGDEIRMCESQLVFLSGSDSDPPSYPATMAG